MYKCFGCEQKSAVVTITKKPDGKRGYICPDCKRAGKDPQNDWYFWSRNQHGHFIVFRSQDNKVASAAAFESNGAWHWSVIGPCWSTYMESGQADSLEGAKKEADTRVMAIIAEEFEPEYVAPLG